jgi:hypothetical protein
MGVTLPGAAGEIIESYDEISNSLRFNDGDSPRLTKTPSGAGNRNTWTFSTWVKKCMPVTGGNQRLIACGSGTGVKFSSIEFDSSDRIRILEGTESGSATTVVNGVGSNRDPSAWYHVVVKYDSTQGTAADRVEIYLNGVEVTYSSTTYPAQNYDSEFNNTVVHTIGATSVGGSVASFLDGYMTEVHLVDGAAKAPTDFGEFDDNGVWIPKRYTGTYGTNGFFMQFKQTGTSANSSGIGADTSGNDNHFAVTNLAATDVTEDTCTNNFATWNPLVGAKSGGSSLYFPTTSEGNLKIADGNAAHNLIGASTIGFTQGKFYAEFKLDSTGDTGSSTGFGTIRGLDNHQNAQYDAGFTNSYLSTGLVFTGASSADSGVTFTTTDTIGVAVDCDNGYIYYHKNGTYINSGNPASGSSGTGGSALVTSSDEEYFFHCMDSRNGNTVTLSANFGNPYYAISSGNTDGKYGNFEYAPPSGYYALCTKRLAEFG